MDLSKIIRTGLAGLATGSLLALVACSGTGTSSVEAGDGPANASSSSASGAGSAPSEPAADSYPSEDVTTEPAPEEPVVATFGQKYVYTDGVEVEVTKIKHGKISKADAEYADGFKAGDDYVMMTIRVKNGSQQRLTSWGSWEMTYGEDGDPVGTPYVDSASSQEKDLSGKILPGKSKTTTEVFGISKKNQKDVVLEFTPFDDHEAAIFAGSIA